MLQPARTKYRKQQKGRNTGNATRGAKVSFGEYGLKATTRGRLTARPSRVAIGIADDVPKRVGWRLLEPAMRLAEPVRIVVREGPADRLVDDLARHALDLVITDAPAHADERAVSQLLGESAIGVFAEARLARRLRRGFPRSLDGVPLLLPTNDTVLRRQVDQWLGDRGIVPDVVAEIQDAALLEVFAEEGAGAFVGPEAIASPTIRRVGTLRPLRQRFYAISVERRLAHPAVHAIASAARARLEGAATT